MTAISALGITVCHRHHLSMPGAAWRRYRQPSKEVVHDVGQVGLSDFLQLVPRAHDRLSNLDETDSLTATSMPPAIAFPRHSELVIRGIACHCRFPGNGIGTPSALSQSTSNRFVARSFAGDRHVMFRPHGIEIGDHARQHERNLLEGGLLGRSNPAEADVGTVREVVPRHFEWPRHHIRSHPDSVGNLSLELHDRADQSYVPRTAAAMLKTNVHRVSASLNRPATVPDGL
jgi:hypothetical protein